MAVVVVRRGANAALREVVESGHAVAEFRRHFEAGIDHRHTDALARPRGAQPQRVAKYLRGDDGPRRVRAAWKKDVDHADHGIEYASEEAAEQLGSNDRIARDGDDLRLAGERVEIL